MKRPLISFGRIIARLFIVLLFCGVECNSSKEGEGPDASDLCGDNHYLEKEWAYSSNTLNPADHFLTVEDGKAIYTFSVPTVFNVCPHEHLVGWMNIEVYKSFSGNVTFAAEILYQVLFTYHVGPWENSGSGEVLDYRANINLGIKDVRK
jgi:hypothetical protein